MYGSVCMCDLLYFLKEYNYFMKNITISGTVKGYLKFSSIT